MSAEVELWLVRHGQTEWNADGKVCGWFDAALTEHGREQARGLRGFLAAHQFTSVWSSDLSRAVETARLALGPARADARLREFHFGDVEGLVWHDLDPAVRDRILEFEGFRAPNGEDMQAFQERVYEFVDGLHPGRHLLFVHAGLIRLLLRAVDNDKFLPPASVAGLEWTRRRFLFIREGCAAV
ncbi:MAG: histidine phosphatase family protein [Candidatus Eremiobacteraeota bacterium]|nr:histidine phosphatase family protein [Candidatus Eremiobacteraeota bacterium]